PVRRANSCCALLHNGSKRSVLFLPSRETCLWACRPADVSDRNRRGELIDSMFYSHPWRTLCHWPKPWLAITEVRWRRWHGLAGRRRRTHEDQGAGQQVVKPLVFGLVLGTTAENRRPAASGYFPPKTQPFALFTRSVAFTTLIPRSW